MAGLGRKVFAAGDVLAAADVDGYLMDQTVQVFAGTAARSSAIGTAVSEGMYTYLSDSNDTQFYNGSAWESQFGKGRNAIINGGFDFWQRGTSFPYSVSQTIYTADRWYFFSSATTTTGTVSQQSFTAGTAPVAGYEGQYFLRVATTTISGANIHSVWQKVEDVRTFANQTATVSFWAKADASRAFGLRYAQQFGTGGSTEVVASIGTFTASTSWQRFTATVTLPSISGKTIGAGNVLSILFDLPQVNGSTFDIWGVQLEAGSVATPFSRAGGTLQGELAACQRYYWRASGSAASQNPLGNAFAISSTTAQCVVKYPVPMRTSPTISTSAAADITFTWSAGTSATSAVNQDLYSTESSLIRITTSGLTVGTGGYYRVEASASKYIDFSAEL